MNPLVAPEAFAREARTALSVNVNKIALLRNSRYLDIPNVVALSRTALHAGAQGITVHPRPDERHIRTRFCTTSASTGFSAKARRGCSGSSSTPPSTAGRC